MEQRPDRRADQSAEVPKAPNVRAGVARIAQGQSPPSSLTASTESDDEPTPTCQTHRFLYQLLDLSFGYFRARGLAVHGEKDALRHLQTHNRPYLDLFL